MEEKRKELCAAVCKEFHVSPENVRTVRAPYRVCPLGAHVDHQNGPVTAMALSESVLFAFAPIAEQRVTVSSDGFDGITDFALDSTIAADAGHWGNYLRGAVLALKNAKFTLNVGLVGRIYGALHGGGVSSSAAVGVAYLKALEHVNDLTVSAEQNIALDRYIENVHLGLNNGILDQGAILWSRKDHLTVINTERSTCELIASPSMPKFKILVAFSGVPRALVSSDYNMRVTECKRAAELLLSAASPGKTFENPVLGDVTFDQYTAHRHVLESSPKLALRAAHFFSEISRVREGIEAWRNGDLQLFGRLMSESGKSSIENYQCGSVPLVDMYNILIAIDGVAGARFSGAGFAGCCVALVYKDAADQCAEKARDLYQKKHPELAGASKFVLCDTADHADVLNDE